MSWTTIAAIYFIVWWIVLFAVLPWGVRSQHGAGEIVPGTDPDAPAIPRLGLKIIWTTIVSGVLMAAVYAVFATKLLNIDDLARLHSNSVRGEFDILFGRRLRVDGSVTASHQERVDVAPVWQTTLTAGFAVLF